MKKWFVAISNLKRNYVGILESANIDFFNGKDKFICRYYIGQLEAARLSASCIPKIELVP